LAPRVLGREGHPGGVGLALELLHAFLNRRRGELRFRGRAADGEGPALAVYFVGKSSSEGFAGAAGGGEAFGGDAPSPLAPPETEEDAGGELGEDEGDDETGGKGVDGASWPRMGVVR